MKKLILCITLISIFQSARTEEFKVLWEIDFFPVSNHVLVSDDGKYFYYNDKGFINFHDSETGTRVNQIAQEKLLIKGSQDYYLNNDRVVLPFTLDSILIYNIATKETEATINLGFNEKSPGYYRSSISPNKRFLSIHCKLEDGNHIIIVDLNQKRLFRDVKISGTIGQLFNTNDPNRMIVTTSDQFGTQLVELTLDETAPLGYRKNIIEEVDKDGEIRGQKYDADEDAFYYLYLPYDLGKRLSKYEFQNKKVTNLYEGGFANEKIWFNSTNEMILYEVGVLHNLITNEYLRLRPLDATRYVAASNDGIETILIREHTSLLNHKLRRLDVIDFLTSVNQSITPLNISVFPNPTTGSINISFTNQHSSIFQYEIISTSGHIVQSGELGYLNIDTNSINLDISSFANSKYILRVFSEQEEFVFNVIKER